MGTKYAHALKVEPILFEDTRATSANGMNRRIPENAPDEWRWRVWDEGKYCEADRAALAAILSRHGIAFGVHTQTLAIEFAVSFTSRRVGDGR